MTHRNLKHLTDGKQTLKTHPMAVLNAPVCESSRRVVVKLTAASNSNVCSSPPVFETYSRKTILERVKVMYL